ncbi:hypothetical protein [Paracoccus sp. PAR01]|uniref:hypothetical protein n=1 Tax=Paracoccus sp. PAR01 TaxID=2769282 RepID=UPI00177EEC47|nr:hypothetical protein [Paracoccus sp. PAR01]MBD9526928.1 hypothetical protein [Paracoccus sp. PAR01]
MNNLIWLIRASRWARNPPSAKRVRLILAIIAICLVIVSIEWMGWWPDWATMDRPRGIHLQRP